MKMNDELEPVWIWVDDVGTNAYAQGYRHLLPFCQETGTLYLGIVSEVHNTAL